MLKAEEPKADEEPKVEEPEVEEPEVEEPEVEEPEVEEAEEPKVSGLSENGRILSQEEYYDPMPIIPGRGRGGGRPLQPCQTASP